MCVFCEEIKNPIIVKQLLGESFPFDSRILYSDKYVLALAGYGPQVFPYVLVLTKRHINSFAKTDNTEKAHVLKCLDWLLEQNIFSSSKLCVFEHGGDSCTGCSSIDHFHLHVIDDSLNFFDSIDWEVGRLLHTITKNSDLADYENYLMIGKYEHGSINAKFNLSNIKESQYFRKKLAALLNNSRWDWKTNMNNEYIEKLVSLVKQNSPAVKPG